MGRRGSRSSSLIVKEDMIRGGLIALTRAATRRRTSVAPVFRRSWKPAQFRFMSGASTEAAKDAKHEPKSEDSQPKADASTESEAAAEAASEGDSKTESEAEPTVEETLQARIQELEAENLEAVDRWKRSLADAENTRQMAQREIANAKKFAVQGFAKSMLDVVDNLARALEHTPEDQRTGDVNPPLRALYEGVQMTEEILMNNLKKHGVTQFTPVDETFDPNIMMALFEMPVPDKEPGTVAQVVKTGFMLNDRVLRPADVGVVKKTE